MNARVPRVDDDQSVLESFRRNPRRPLGLDNAQRADGAVPAPFNRGISTGAPLLFRWGRE